MDADWDARVLLGLMLDEPTRHFSPDELVRLLGWPLARVEDAVAGLARDGLVHRHGEFVFAGRAAVRAAELV